MSLEYTSATEDDIPALISIERSLAGSKTYSPMLDKREWRDAIQKGKVFVIKRGEEIVGNTSYEDQGNGVFYLSGLAILPAFQRMGIGREVLQKVLGDLKDAKKIELVTHPGNGAALALYQKMGFKVESRRENYFGDGEPRLILSKTA
jgi:[ribosomal protein S18]-alanine N-acetyltransferase